ncbi:MAG: Na+/H+ antiporter NhaC family protein [Cytophagales bacterium]|nr:Na+/H+ antiporter NhaC family protein [Cytophagales bacterium]
MNLEENQQTTRLDFYGGLPGCLLPFVVFLSGVIILALSGAPDERGFWPILIFALGLGLLLAKDRKSFSEVVITGMSQRIIMIMITAWMLASTIGILMTRTGFVEALIWISVQMHLGPVGFLLATLLICCIVSLSTGSSFATILICSPLLYPAGGIVGVHLPLLAGAILAGATFGDFTAPISDTTIASALSQDAEIGPTVKSRLKYSMPIIVLSAIVYMLLQWTMGVEKVMDHSVTGDPGGLPMLLVPVLITFLFLRGKHLLYGLMAGLGFGLVLGLVLGLLPFSELVALDLDNFRATSLIIDGINRSVGISFFTILLMGLVETIKASGVLDKLLEFAANRVRSQKSAQRWISAIASLAVLFTTHSIVAILMVKEFVQETGKQAGISGIHRANLMSMAACVFPFLLPYFIPVILMANMTQTGNEFDLPSLGPLEVGFYNFVSWGLFVVLLLIIVFGTLKRPNAA